jgi:hypothetical protein
VNISSCRGAHLFSLMFQENVGRQVSLDQRDRPNIRMYEEHLKTCEYCQKNDRAAKLAKLGKIIRGEVRG